MLTGVKGSWVPSAATKGPPGYIATDMGKPLMEDPVRNKEIIDRIPSKAWGDPKVFKDVVVFLASEASNYICGATIPVDGGFLCR